MPRLLLALLLVSGVASAQTLSLTPAPIGPRTITVQGQGEATAAADHARLRFQVVTEGATLDEALRLHETEVARVQALLRDAGVPDARVTLDRVAVGDDEEDGPGFRPDDSGGEVVRVTRAVTAEVDDLDAVDGLVGQLASREGDDALTTQMRSVVVSFERRDVTALRETALREAVRDARRRADLAAEVSGVRVGRMLSVTEGGVTGTMFFSGPTPGADRVAAMMGGMMGGGSGEHVESARVIVVYEAD
ncbi:MAG TPA: SIMPL domain-containing protein [Rubricoccaceae bacterium]|jgi:hypothetical protein